LSLLDAIARKLGIKQDAVDQLLRDQLTDDDVEEAQWVTIYRAKIK
jgi:hypothetical protein